MKMETCHMAEHYRESVSQFAQCCENRPVTVWKYKSPKIRYSAMVREVEQ